MLSRFTMSCVVPKQNIARCCPDQDHVSSFSSNGDCDGDGGQTRSLLDQDHVGGSGRGGGDSAEFDLVWTRILPTAAAVADAASSERWHNAIFHLIWTKFWTSALIGRLHLSVLKAWKVSIKVAQFAKSLVNCAILMLTKSQSCLNRLMKVEQNIKPSSSDFVRNVPLKQNICLVAVIQESDKDAGGSPRAFNWFDYRVLLMY